MMGKNKVAAPTPDGTTLERVPQTEADCSAAYQDPDPQGGDGISRSWLRWTGARGDKVELVMRLCQVIIMVIVLGCEK